MNVEALIPRWLRKEEEDWSMSDDVIVPPPVARLPMPEQTDDEKRLATIATAHVYVEQLRQERATDRAEIEQLRSDMAALKQQLQSEQRKSGLLELELAKEINDRETQYADAAEKERCLSLLKQVLDKFGTKAPPKKERKPDAKKAKAERKGTEQTPETDGGIQAGG